MITTPQEIDNYFQNLEKEIMIDKIQVKLEDVLQDIKWLKETRLLYNSK